MKSKKILTIILVLFVVAAAGTAIKKVIGTNDSTDPVAENSISLKAPQQSGIEDSFSTANSANVLAQPDANVDMVYYFMTTQRCASCMKIDTFTREAVQEHYSEKLDNDTLMMQMVNLDEPENIHFIQDYQLFTKSVVLVRYRDGKQLAWKNLDQVWSLLGDQAAFSSYIVSEIDSFFEES
ncbi:hypothetical protein ES708_33769 [subsurface metagenome]